MNNPEVISETERRYDFNKVIVILSAFFMICASLLLILGLKTITNYIITGVFYIGFIVTLVINFKTWRCPKCNTYLSVGRALLYYPKHCGNCGIPVKK